MILAGDANLLSLMKHLVGCNTGSETSLNKQLAAAFLDDMVVANATKGEPQATHDRGGILDLVLVDKALQI